MNREGVKGKQANLREPGRMAVKPRDLQSFDI